jgi:hypothetical protein
MIRIALTLLLILSILTPTSRAVAEPAAVYFKNGSIWYGEKVVLSGDKVLLTRFGELVEIDKNDVLLEQSIKTIEKAKNIKKTKSKSQLADNSMESKSVSPEDSYCNFHDYPNTIYRWTDVNGTLLQTGDILKIPKTPPSKVYCAPWTPYEGNDIFQEFPLKYFQKKRRLAEIKIEKSKAEEKIKEARQKEEALKQEEYDNSIRRLNKSSQRSSYPSGNLDAEVREAEKFHSDMVDWANKMNTRKPNDPYPKIGR